MIFACRYAYAFSLQLHVFKVDGQLLRITRNSEVQSNLLYIKTSLVILHRQQPHLSEYNLCSHPPSQLLENDTGTWNKMTPPLQATNVILSMDGGLFIEKPKAELGRPPVFYEDILTPMQVRSS